MRFVSSAVLVTLALGGVCTCKQCHGTYREGTPQEGFRIKADAGTK
jgi:hypothetical protein